MSLYGGVNIVGCPDLENVRRLDLLPMKCISEMQQIGMAIDKQWFADLTVRLDDEISDLKKSIYSYIPPDKLDEFIARSEGVDDEPFNVNSTSELAELLFNILGIGKDRELKRTKSGKQISTGKKQLEQFKKEPVVQDTLAYKERIKLKNTYTTKLPLIAKFHPERNCWCGVRHFGETWRIHSTLVTTRTSTGRLASKDPNLQNIPARSELGRLVRAGFIASPGTELVAVDFSQFEMRLGAHYSEDDNLIRIFQDELDPHTDTAMRAFKKSKIECTTIYCVTCGYNTKDSALARRHVEQYTDHLAMLDGRLLYRAPSKNLNFGIFYGLTAAGLYDLMILSYATAGLDVPEWLTQDWCQGFIDLWFKDLYAKVQGYVDQQYYRAKRYEIVWTLLGRVRRVPEVCSVHKRVVSSGLRQAGNAPIQGTQADLNKIALAEIREFLSQLRADGVWAWPVMTIHDEVLIEVEQGYGEYVQWYCEYIMSRCMTDRDSGEEMCRVPIKAEGHVMQRWEK